MFNPPDPGSFNKLVWQIVKQIPEGIVSSYGQIASMIPPPSGVDPEQYVWLGARWVGNAMNMTPGGQSIPWQRVINSQGEISLPKGSANAEEQRALLEMEGVTFDDRGRVDFNKVGWQGPEDAWQSANGFFPPRPLKKSAPKQDNPPDDNTQLSLF
jgi:methylated-DNA-protein-cysteine methyltransferase-like protein